MGGAASLLQRSVDSAVDTFLDEDERFVHLVMISFDDDADASQQLPASRVLKALVSVYELVAATLPPAGRRLVMRCDARSVAPRRPLTCLPIARPSRLTWTRSLGTRRWTRRLTLTDTTRLREPCFAASWSTVGGASWSAWPAAARASRS